MVAFKDLCIDAVDVDRAATFWSQALGLSTDADRGGRLTGAVPEQTVWINAVPEPVTVKQRVHLDLFVALVADLLDLGARVLNVTPDWTVLADPEGGGELCAFVRDPAELPAYRVAEVVVDAADHVAISRWWADRFGVSATHDQERGFSWIKGAPGMPWPFVFQPVPEPKTVKNRIHWDLYGDVDTVVEAGATVLAELPRWTVLADPEGNEFCVFPEANLSPTATP